MSTPTTDELAADIVRQFEAFYQPAEFDRFRDLIAAAIREAVAAERERVAKVMAKAGCTCPPSSAYLDPSQQPHEDYCPVAIAAEIRGGTA